jgi:hypothetical protein
VLAGAVHACWAGLVLIGLPACSTADDESAPSREAGTAVADSALRETALAEAGSGTASNPEASVMPDAGHASVKFDASVPRDAQPADARTRDAIDAGLDAGPVAPNCEVGIADKEAGRYYTPLPDGEAIPLIGGSQSALLAELGLRIKAPPLPCEYDVTLRAKVSGREERVVRDADASDFDCDGEWCTLVPVYVPTVTLVDDPYALDDLEVRVEVVFRAADQDAAPTACEATLDARLYRFL